MSAILQATTNRVEYEYEYVLSMYSSTCTRTTSADTPQSSRSPRMMYTFVYVCDDVRVSYFHCAAARAVHGLERLKFHLSPLFEFHPMRGLARVGKPGRRLVFSQKCTFLFLSSLIGIKITGHRMSSYSSSSDAWQISYRTH